MKKGDLERLLRSAAQVPAEPPAEVPFGFDTRVIAESRTGGFGIDDIAGITRLLRRAGAIGLAVLIVAGGAFYRQFRDQTLLTAPQTNEFAIADSAIQTEFSQ